MKTEEVTAVCDIVSGPYGARAKDEKFIVPVEVAEQLALQGFVKRGAKAAVSGDDKA